MTSKNNALEPLRGQEPSRRLLGKQEAIQHLIHGAIRLIMKMEDPFAIHLLVQSADKLLADVAKKSDVHLSFNWETAIKKEYQAVFFERYRELYNFLKHANVDFNKDLPVNDIMRLNVLGLLICTENYRQLYNVMSDHMRIYVGFLRVLMPSIIEMPGSFQGASFQMENLSQMTPKEFFDLDYLLPEFAEERSVDLRDILSFYETPFVELRKMYDR